MSSNDKQPSAPNVAEKQEEKPLLVWAQPGKPASSGKPAEGSVVDLKRYAEHKAGGTQTAEAEALVTQWELGTTDADSPLPVKLIMVTSGFGLKRPFHSGSGIQNCAA
ncbi:hypothetical protein [Paenibacillus piri]|uniref:Uncharacterized protein n=1 Tax=Paenibacillus piri TaxID=2547395 RepID=A0A4R5KFH4_9BACL|nr:hypothetical protein [Paenibacillus piri]TDF94131.1 hypothetical protein E1757_24900 [Paenibacillus piri]